MSKEFNYDKMCELYEELRTSLHTYRCEVSALARWRESGRLGHETTVRMADQDWASDKLAKALADTAAAETALCAAAAVYLREYADVDVVTDETVTKFLVAIKATEFDRNSLLGLAEECLMA